jgi:hypothetical protein
VGSVARSEDRADLTDTRAPRPLVSRLSCVPVRVRAACVYVTHLHSPSLLYAILAKIMAYR